MSNIKAYQEQKTQGKIRLHANESPYNNLPQLLKEIEPLLASLNINEYPALNADELKSTLAQVHGVSSENIIIGNGSDELITYVMQRFLKPNDVVVTHSPTFSQYAWNASLLHVDLVSVNDKPNYEINIDGLIEACNQNNAKLCIVCTPNNPTGSLISKEDLNRIHKETSCFIMIDEAYFDFVDQNYQSYVLSSPRMISLRTFSKAYGLAGIRFGYGIAQQEVIQMINQVRQPYNVNAITQLIAQSILKQSNLIQSQIESILKSKDLIMSALQDCGCTLAPSMANFILFSHPSHELIESVLWEHGFAIKSFHNTTSNHLRISIPNEENTKTLITVLRGMKL
ncbi:MAG: histidinol-phosphate transaminase [Erysipelothrix sp.]|nr:histidinol-phosphate transaminase [Erysipelothrix sp.]